MEVEEFESYLTMDELANFKRNLEKLRGSAPKIDYDTYVKRMEYGDVVTGAFAWSDAPEGLDYWVEICSRLIERRSLINRHMRGYDYMQFFTAEQWSKLCAIAMEFLGTEVYDTWMESKFISITNFLGCGIPTSKQSEFITNIKVADNTTFRMMNGFIVKSGEFLTKSRKKSAYTSTTRIHAGL